MAPQTLISNRSLALHMSPFSLLAQCVEGKVSQQHTQLFVEMFFSRQIQEIILFDVYVNLKISKSDVWFLLDYPVSSPVFNCQISIFGIIKIIELFMRVWRWFPADNPEPTLLFFRLGYYYKKYSVIIVVSTNTLSCWVWS